MSKQSRLIIILGILLGAFVPMAASALPTVSLSVVGGDIHVGDAFDVEVLADGDGIGRDLLAFGFDLSVAGPAFSYSGYTVGPGFGDDSFLPVDVAGSAFPPLPGDDVLLATLTFTGEMAGSSVLSIAGLYDGLFSGLYYDLSLDEVFPEYGLNAFDIEASLEIAVAGAQVPEPGTLLLVGAGFVGLVVSGRRRHKAK